MTQRAGHHRMPVSLVVVVVVVWLGVVARTSECAVNRAPRFTPPLHANYFFAEYNATRPGDVLLWLNASDPDGDELTFGVEGGDFYKRLVEIRQLERQRAVVVARQPFDRELQDKYDNVVFFVQDKPGNKVHQSVRFVVTDIDDNEPRFVGAPYHIRVAENQPVHSTLLDTIEAYDADGPLHNKFTFAIAANDDDISSSMFAIERTRVLESGRLRASLVLKRPLDYEQASVHTLRIRAVSTRHAAAGGGGGGGGGQAAASTASVPVEALVYVHVVDVDDMRPQFAQAHYFAKIDEEMPPGSVVLQVEARDGDRGINNPCVYHIEDEDGDESPIAAASDYFEVEHVSGRVTVKQRIDLESSAIGRVAGIFELNVIATELTIATITNGSHAFSDDNNDNDIDNGIEATLTTTSSRSSTRLTIVIGDVNDHRPAFDRLNYTLSVSPTAANGTALALVSTELDGDEDDASKQQQQQQRTIHVFDADKGANGSFSLSLRKVNDDDDVLDFDVWPKLALNDATPLIKLVNSANLLALMGTTQHYQLIARDNGVEDPNASREARDTRVDVFVRVANVNRHAPTFEHQLYVFHLAENATPNTTVGYVRALDMDARVNDAQCFHCVHYELSNSSHPYPFAIDESTGRVYTTEIRGGGGGGGELDRETMDTFYMSVEAVDGGGLRSNARLCVKLVDVNDNAPRFVIAAAAAAANVNNNAGSRSSGVKPSTSTPVGVIEENSHDGWLSAVELRAVDMDAGANGRVVYQIVHADLVPVEWFVVEPSSNASSSIIRLADGVTLDFEAIVSQRKENTTLASANSVVAEQTPTRDGEVAVHLVAMARDLGSPSLNTTIRVTIIVKV